MTIKQQCCFQFETYFIKANYKTKDMKILLKQNVRNTVKYLAFCITFATDNKHNDSKTLKHQIQER